MSFLERTPYENYRLGSEGDKTLTPKPANEERAKVPKKKKSAEDPGQQFSERDLKVLNHFE